MLVSDQEQSQFVGSNRRLMENTFFRMFDPIERHEPDDNIGMYEFHSRNYGLFPIGK